MNITKICKCCKIEKDLLDFYKKSRSKDGFQDKCKLCEKEYKKSNKDHLTVYRKNYSEANKDKLADYHKEHKIKNKDKIASQKRDYYEANKDRISLYYKINKDKIAERRKDYYLDNKSYFIACAAKRKAAKLQATPKWLTKEHLEQIQEFYKQSYDLKLLTNKEYHVDHIVPLQGKTVCGLHVPWNLQILTAEENIAKSNKFDTEQELS